MGVWGENGYSDPAKREEMSKARLLPEEPTPQQEETPEIGILDPEVREVPPIPRKPRKAPKKKAAKKIVKKK